MCEETALMRFVEQFEDNPILQKLQKRIANRIKDASEDEICEIVVDEMFKYHEEMASYYRRNTPDNQYPTKEEREKFADVALYNLIPHSKIPDEISLAGLYEKRLEMREYLKELQDDRIKSGSRNNNQNNK